MKRWRLALGAGEADRERDGEDGERGPVVEHQAVQVRQVRREAERAAGRRTDLEHAGEIRSGGRGAGAGRIPRVVFG